MRRIGRGMGIGIGVGKQSGFSWSRYWATRTPLFNLPEDGVSLLVGKEVVIYGDSLINIPIGRATEQLTVNYTCDIGEQDGRNYIISPVDGDIGTHSLIAVFKNGSYIITTNTINLNVIANAPTGSAKILMIGDSLVWSGITKLVEGLDGALTPTFTYHGSLGTTIKHEGQPGRGWESIIISAGTESNPNHFIKEGALNIPAFFTDYSINTPDFVLIRLGVNDAFGGSDTVAYSDGLTDARIEDIVDASKTFIDAFLAFDANLKILIGLPSISENTGAGWNDNYDESRYNQDNYIKSVHKIWGGLIDAYANGLYDSRVDLSYEPIFLDRNDGYPKTDGIHNNGVHCDDSGYVQLGEGLSLSVNKLFQARLAPTSFAAVWTDDYAALTWDDNTGGVSTYEIWESKNGGAYSLVFTTAAGAESYNYYCWQNADMNFKVRAKSDAWLSEFSVVVNLVTPLVWKTDQSTLTNVVINSLGVAVGKTVNVDWGDGTNNDYSGVNTNITKGYGVGNEANPYYIKISGDVNSIITLNHYSQVKSYGDLTKWVLPSSIQTLRISENNFTGNISGWVLPSSMTYIGLSDQSGTSGMGGDISGWQLPAGLIFVFLGSNGSSSKLIGNLSTWSLNNGTLYFYVPGQDLTGMPRGHYKGFAAGFEYYAAGNNCNQAEMDSLMSYLDGYFTTETPIKNMKLTLNGTGMAAPSAAGTTSINSIKAKFTAAGFTATISVNS